MTVLVALAIALSGYSTPATMQDGGRCEEDMQCWDCETMGNGDCAEPLRFLIDGRLWATSTA